jgi:hypothetical protein
MLTTGLSATLLASLLAQAEPAPPEPAPAQAGPAEAAPAEAGPAEQAPPEPTAPSPAQEPTSSAEEDPEVPPSSSIAVHGRFAYHPGDDASFAPREGFSLGATFHHRFTSAASLLGVGVEIALFHDQFSNEGTYIGLAPRRLVHDSFVAMPTLALEGKPARPWIAAGGGLTVAQTATTEVQPVARGAIGVDFTIAKQTALVVRGDYTYPLRQPKVVDPASSPYGAFMDVGVGILYRF